MASVLKGLVGKSATPASQPTAYNTLPDFGQTLLKNTVTQGQSTAADPNNFSAIPLMQGQTEALNKLLAGGPDVSGVGGFNFGQQANQAFGNASSMYNTASDYLKQGAAPITGDQIGSSINDFMNPFENSVVQNSVNDINTEGNGLFSNARSLISDAGGSGSNRGDLLAGDISKGLMKQVGDTSSSIRNTGFQSAANNALTRLMGDRTNALSAGNGQTAAANGSSNLGNMLMSARMNMDTLRNNSRTNQINDLNNQIGAGNIYRGVDQQNQQIPQQQLQMLEELFKLFPTGGGGTGATAATGAGGGTNFLGSLAAGGINAGAMFL